MANRHPFVLALFPNSRGVGYVALSGPQHLVDYGMTSVRPFCRNKLVQRVQQLLEYCKPTLLVLQDTDALGNRAGQRSKALIADIQRMATTKGLPVHLFTREQVKDVFEQFGARTKFEIAKTLVKWHPVLKPKEVKPRFLWQSEHHNQGIFDALSLALTYYYLHD